MNIVWKIEKLNSRDSDGYVTAANVKVYVDDGIGNNFITLVCSWPNGEIRTLARGDSFIPYDQLTEAQVLAWCFEPVVTTWTDRDNVEQSSISLVKEEGESQVAGQIDRQLAQVAAEPALPWVKI